MIVLPMLRQVFGHQIVERSQRDLVGLELVQQAGEVGGETECALDRPVEAGEELAQEELASQRTDRRGTSRSRAWPKRSSLASISPSG